MWSIRLSPSDQVRDGLLAELWDCGTSGIIEEPTGSLRAFFEAEEQGRLIQSHFSAIASELREEPAPPPLNEDDGWEPVFAGEKFVIVPKGIAPGADFGGRIPLGVNAAMAFGSGRHESTQLCLQALEIYVNPGQTVIDIGCGSGILSLAAQRLGAGMVIACDIQPDAIRTAQEHYQGPIFQGSADAIAASSAEVVLSNISARINDRIAADLRRILKPGGVVILSGFVGENTPKRFRPLQEFAQGDWLCWICTGDCIEAEEDGKDVNSHPADWWM
jgi:ribosomal protein L11 methyltransferase